MRIDLKPVRTGPRDNTIALINIVFLMLVFFMLAGTLAPRPDTAVAPVEADAGEALLPRNAVSLHSDGTLQFAGTMLADGSPLPSALAGEPEILLYADRQAPAISLIAAITRLEALSDKPVVLMLERRNGS